MMSLGRWVVGTSLAIAFAASGCKCGGDKHRQLPPGADLPPLTAPSPTASLNVQGFSEAVVNLPVGATRPMPVLVAVLGIGDSPEEQCAAWRDIVGDRAFVLCPRGAKNMVQDDDEAGAGPASASASPSGSPMAAATTTATTTAPATTTTTTERADPDSPSLDPAPSEGPKRETADDDKPVAPPVPKSSSGGARAPARQVGFYPVDLSTLDREVTAGLSALKARFGQHVAEAEPIYAGFSRGAFLGASLAAKRPNLFRRVILIEGGQSAWQPESAAAFAKGGGKRVLFVCGQPQCLEESEPAAATLRTQKIETRVVHGAGEGHGYKKQVKEELKKSFDWVTDGDLRWP